MNDFFDFRIYLTISYSSVLRNTAKLLLTHCFTSLQRFHLIRFTFGIYVTFIFDGSCRLPHAAPYRISQKHWCGFIAFLFHLSRENLLDMDIEILLLVVVNWIILGTQSLS